LSYKTVEIAIKELIKHFGIKSNNFLLGREGEGGGGGRVKIEQYKNFYK